jgi:hypothetical protein
MIYYSLLPSSLFCNAPAANPHRGGGDGKLLRLGFHATEGWVFPWRSLLITQGSQYKSENK